MLVLHRANCSRRLVEALVQVLAEPLADPFMPETIAVQSRGMERWLAMELGRHFGVWANPRFPFPRHVLETAFDRVLGPLEGPSVFDDGTLELAVAGCLPACLDDPAFSEIAHYLRDDEAGELCLQLSQRIARVFDDYTAYRPEMVLGWEAGEGEDWQPRLWRALVERHGAGHQAARARDLLEGLSRAEGAVEGLWPRLCLFGVSALPPLHVSVLDALARHVELHLFVLSPSREFFGDLRRGRGEVPDAAEAPERGLLASLGRQGREFQSLLEERASYAEAEEDLYVDPGTGTLLATLQSDILHLRARPSPEHPALPLSPDDRSVRVHACHGPMRELEVLHDQLLDALDADPTLEPHDIIVMAPDIETYAPLIEAVFGASGRPRLPYSVSHRRARSTDDVLDALFSLVDVLGGRLGASAVLDLLAIDCVRERFEVAPEELDTLRRWVDESGIRWGQDAGHRAQVGQPAFEDNSWRFGLDRLLLGHAMGDVDLLFEGRLPHATAEGSEAALLGRLCEFCERLFEHRGAVEAPRGLTEWADTLGALLDAFVAAGPAWGAQLASIREGLSELAARAVAVGLERPVDRTSLMRLLEDGLDRKLPARGFLSGGVTFCQLVPMRSIPFRVVCLLGMDDDGFPGRTSRPSFDRMAASRQPGDRSRRDDDRYMFLEAVLAARQRLHVSYTGQGIHDNAVYPPSVVVLELLDQIDRSFTSSKGREGRVTLPSAALVTRHRMHAFSPHYFRGESGMFSYARQFESGARAVGGPRRAPDFLPRALPAEPAGRELQLSDLELLVTRPCQALMQRRLGLTLGREVAPLEEREPIEVNALARWGLGTRLMQLALEGRGPDATLPLLRAAGSLPVGTPGTLLYERLWPGSQALSVAVRAAQGGEALPPLSVDLEIAGVRLMGTLRGLYPGAHLSASYSALGRRFELVHWVRHLVLCTLWRRGQARGYPYDSVVIGRVDEAVASARFEPPDAPEALLSDLIALATAAECRRVPFSAGASRAYVDSVAARGHGSALGEAQKAFQRRLGDHETDPYLRVLFPSFEDMLAVEAPLDFAATARRVYEPFLAHRSAR